MFFELGIPLLENLSFPDCRALSRTMEMASTHSMRRSASIGALQTSFVVRGSFGTSFKAPSIYQTQATEFIDPGWGSVGDPTDADYVGGFGRGSSRALLNEVIAPNPDLEPQESDNWSLGFDWNITENVSLGVDYVSIDFQNIIYIPSPTQMFQTVSL